MQIPTTLVIFGFGGGNDQLIVFYFYLWIVGQTVIQGFKVGFQLGLTLPQPLGRID